MAFRAVEFAATVRFQPDKARDCVLEKFREAGANLKETAKLFGVSYRTMHRWIETLDVQDRLEKLRAKAIREGWHRADPGGRPRERVDGRGSKKS